MDKNIKLNLSDESLVGLLNFILSMVKEDRQNALDHHDILSRMLEESAESEGLTGIEVQILLNDLSQALTGFLNNTGKCTEQTIKVAKIMADHLLKMDKSASLTDDDRAEIEEALTDFKDIKDKGTGLIKNIKFDTKE